ncbi:MAG TPA: EF-P beta-lysylation protein EpmB [Pirellulales bacterium]|nr:EF-P beta-lysylation protein EpmB [Pirellulales bacterium]
MIIPAPPPPVGAEIEKKPPCWQSSLKEAVRDPAELCRLLRLPEHYIASARRAARDFPLFAPRGFVSRMRPGDPLDPLLLQVLPLSDELSEAPHFVADPVGDRQAETAPGLLHKYYGRVLLVTTGACAVHCRYCFRRHFPYSDGPHSLTAWQPALDQIAADPTIEEVILSGGDPLTLVDAWLAQLVGQIGEIPHVRRLRIHTRLPIVLPERVCPELLDWLCGTRLTPIVVVHANHPAELCSEVAAALSQLADRGVVLLNQAVLLRRINDNADVLVELCRRLVELRVMPYYLHQLDRVRGAAHFEVPESAGREITAELRRRLPGYAVPRYVRETPGAAYKEPIDGRGTEFVPS